MVLQLNILTLKMEVVLIQKGDLLIYGKSTSFPYGHVAVIVNVDLVKIMLMLLKKISKIRNGRYEFIFKKNRIKKDNNNFIITDISFKSKKRYTNSDTK